MFKIIRMETASGAESQLNKLQEDGWRVVGCGPDYVVLTDARPVVSKRRHVNESELAERFRRHLRETADLNREVEDLRKMLKAHQDDDSAKHWDSLLASRNLYRTVAGELFEALCWASAASDFSPGDEVTGVPAGQAREGWESGPRLAMEAYQAAQCAEREGNREQ